MPKISEISKNLRPYLFHGLDLEGSPNAVGECPFCGREKFSVNVETGLWRCLICDEKGNLTSFLRDLHVLGLGKEDDLGLVRLSKERGVSLESLVAFGVVVHPVTDEITVPGFSTDRKLMNLYQYMTPRGGSKKVLQGTSTVNQQLFIPDDFDSKKHMIFAHESPWNAMAHWDAMRTYKETEDGLVKTGSVEASLYTKWKANIIGLPGCGSVGEPFSKWCSLFSGKDIVLCFDSDHPRVNGDKRSEPAGMEACKRACEIMARQSEGPDTVQYLKWGLDGYDKDQKSGYDVRDLLTEGDQREGLTYLLSKIEPIPAEWVKGRSATSKKSGKVQIDCLSCTSWRELIPYWRKAMKWIDGLDKGLSVCFASIVSTRAVGDQLWIKMVGPPSCGKTTLVEALAVAKPYVYATDTMTGLVSGYQIDREGSENMSMVLKLKDKTLVIKDADTILSDPALPKILSQFRAFYDRALRTQYGNKMSAAHEGINSTVILCGTNSLRKLDSSELGERFLDVVIMDKIDLDLEDEILYRKFHQSKNDLATESNGQPESQVGPAMLAAMQRTGGYVTYLRQNARELLAAINYPEEVVRELIDYGKFIAYMRARPSSRQEETAEREFAARLVSQITRLAGCLAVVLNKKMVDEEVMSRVKSVVMDTARGRTLTLTRHLHKTREEGLPLATLAALTHETDDKEKILLKFLRTIGVCETYTKKKPNGTTTRPKWRLQANFQSLCDRILL